MFVVKCYRKYNLPLTGLHRHIAFYYQNVIKFGFNFSLTACKFVHMKKAPTYIFRSLNSNIFEGVFLKIFILN